MSLDAPRRETAVFCELNIRYFWRIRIALIGEVSIIYEADAFSELRHFHQPVFLIHNSVGDPIIPLQNAWENKVISVDFCFIYKKS